jgi:uncharacterized protein YneF (UPF0154 family)
MQNRPINEDAIRGIVDTTGARFEENKKDDIMYGSVCNIEP